MGDNTKSFLSTPCGYQRLFAIGSLRIQGSQQKLKIKNKNSLIWGLLAASVIIGLIGFFLFKEQSLKTINLQRENELTIAKVKIEQQNKLAEQRLSISRDLHDNIGTHLTFILSSIDTIKYFIKEQNDQIENRLSGLNSFVKATITELRDTIWAMNKQNITVDNIIERTINLIYSAQAALPDKSLNINDKRPEKRTITFSAPTGMNIYRIIQEAINNSIKHADADEVNLDIYEKDGLIYFQIKDNGKGFDTTDSFSGNGLNNMKKRVEGIGALYTITSNESGTMITLGIKEDSA